MVSAAGSSSVLVIGSMHNIEVYQAKVLEMKSQAADLRSEMMDRILDQAALLEPEAYDRALVLVTPQDLEQHLPGLLALVQPALKTGSALEIQGPSATTRAALEAAGWQNIQTSETAIVASKPAPVASVPLRLKRPSANGTRKSSIWATSPAPSTPTIDESSLLTPDDLKRRQTIQKPDCDVKRTRKACKDCSCGLREILLQEDSDLMAIQAARAKALPVQTNADGKQVVNTGAMTSSCGSCSLGDAFRCASCPYLGMPAFEPGQKIELGASSFGGDDLP